ncbi:MAG: phosphotransferase [Oscillospiraceae bacterium]
MRETEKFLSSFDPLPDGFTLPTRVLPDYEPDSCLSDKGERFVWRLRRRTDGALFVLKASPAELENLMEEFQILSRLAPLLPGSVPVPMECFQEDGMVYLLRSYLPGETLAQYREREGGCPVQMCVRLGQKLCALLETLHSQDPPVIHRDIKPENLILLPDGEVGLIDFGIARQYKAGQDTDTRRMGTRSTAAPEQYGYAQTDCRTDLYALGMTLIWLLTGTYDRDGLAQAEELPAYLRRTLEKAVSFAPEDRYQDAAAFSAALANRSPRRKLRVLLPAAVLLCLLAVGAGLLWPKDRNGELAPAGMEDGVTLSPEPDLPAAEPEVEFTSASMEAAVRQALQKPEGSITYDELAGIQRLAVVGGTAFSAEQAFDYRIGSYIDNQYQADQPWGDITDGDLALLSYMPDLKELYLCRQEIRDISALTELHLTTLALCENKIMDFSPLASLTELETLYLGDNPATDYSVLAGLTRLRILTVEGSGVNGVAAVDSLDFLNGLTLQELGLGLTVPKDGDWSPLSTQIALEKLLLWDPPEAAVEAANTLSGLKTLFLCDYFRDDLTMLSGLASLEVLNVHKGNVKSLEGVGSLSRLITLAVGLNGVSDLSPLVGLERLNYVKFEGLPISDFSPLAELPALGYVYVDQEQVAAVEAACPGYTFQLRTD